MSNKIIPPLSGVQPGVQPGQLPNGEVPGAVPSYVPTHAPTPEPTIVPGHLPPGKVSATTPPHAFVCPNQNGRYTTSLFDTNSSRQIPPSGDTRANVRPHHIHSCAHARLTRTEPKPKCPFHKHRCSMQTLHAKSHLHLQVILQESYQVLISRPS